MIEITLQIEDARAAGHVIFSLERRVQHFDELVLAALEHEDTGAALIYKERADDPPLLLLQGASADSSLHLQAGRCP